MFDKRLILEEIKKYGTIENEINFFDYCLWCVESLNLVRQRYETRWFSFFTQKTCAIYKTQFHFNGVIRLNYEQRFYSVDTKPFKHLAILYLNENDLRYLAETPNFGYYVFEEKHEPLNLRLDWK